uniref:Ribosomal protein L7Ae/L30e/S12e/Gadd45 domain-containing protein n=1 Tax=Salix viminalis TaxID=40686 RepID=A0A6N2N4H9_SALVM
MGSDSETERSNIKVKKKMTDLAPISKPSAGKKLCKQTLKLVRKASESKCLKRGVKEVGHISPIDVITHALILCEEADIPYVYVSSKEATTKRPQCCVQVLTKPTKGNLGKEDQEKLRADYDQVVSDIFSTFLSKEESRKCENEPIGNVYFCSCSALERVYNRVAVVVAARFFVLALLAPPCFL